MIMKSRFVYNGAQRLRKSKEFQSRLHELRDSIRARHAAQLAVAGFFRRCVLHWRMAAEYRRERKLIIPSPQSLYVDHREAGRFGRV